jgi:alanine racemase
MDVTDTLGQGQILISRTALLHNVKLLRQSIPDGTQICAIIKANAYGHGAALVADALTNFTSDHLEAPAVDALAVATLEEAEALGPCVVPIHVLRPIESIYVQQQREQLQAAIREGWILTLASAQAAGDLARLAMHCGQRALVQVMIDTGIAREGAPLDAVDAIIASIESHAALKLTGLCTHFANAEEPATDFAAEQLSRFQSATETHVLRNQRIVRHAANSAAIFFSPESHLDMVRPGMSIYGIDPSCRPCIDRPLRPVLKWTAPLLMIRDLPAGAAVGYGQSWQSPRPTRIGLVPVGYADGYVRSFSNRAMMLVRGTPVRVVGRVSMDYITIDLGDLPQASVGDDVTVLDNDPLSPASIYALSRLADTIPHEILCRLGLRMPRVAVDPADEEPQTWHMRDSTLAERSA